jgi:putative transposase
MSYARPIKPQATYLVTRRTERRHCLLRPDDILTRFILFALAVCAHRHTMQLHAFCAMSTHIHYVISDPEGRLPRFLELFHRLVALGVKIIRKWDGAVWDRSQTSVVELTTREAIIEKIAYTLANPVAAGLVESAGQWPGAKTSIADIGPGKIHTERPDVYFNKKNPKWHASLLLHVVLPPSIPESEAQSFRDKIAEEVDRIESHAQGIHAEREFLGVDEILKISPESRITSHEPKAQRNPTFAAGKNHQEASRKAVESLHQFRRAYHHALTQWRAGNRFVEFPAGTYAMRVLHGAIVAQSMRDCDKPRCVSDSNNVKEPDFN